MASVILAHFSAMTCHSGYVSLQFDLFTSSTVTCDIFEHLLGLCFLKSSAEEHLNCIEQLLAQKIPVDQTEPQRGRSCLQDLVPWLCSEFLAQTRNKYRVDRIVHSPYRRWMMKGGTLATLKLLLHICRLWTDSVKQEPV